MGIVDTLDGEKFAPLNTTVDASDDLLKTVNLKTFKNRTFLLKKVSAVEVLKASIIGNTEFALLYDPNSTITEVYAKENQVRGSFQSYVPLLKIFLSDNDKFKKVKKIERPLKPVKMLVRALLLQRCIVTIFSTFAAKLTGINQEVKEMKDSNGYLTHSIMLTKLYIVVAEEDFEISAWSHIGIFLANLLQEYVGSIVGFANVEASSWVGKTMTKTNLNFGADSKLKLPDKKANVSIKVEKLQDVPTSLIELVGFEGMSQRMCIRSVASSSI